MTKFAGVRAVLFDLDGTLVDSAPELGAAADRMRTKRGLPSIPLQAYRHMAGAGARGMLGIAFGITPEAPDYESLREEFFLNYEECMLLNTPTFEGVPQLVSDLLYRGFRWGIVTNKSMRFTDPLVRSIPSFSTASAVVSGDTTPFSKPHPEPLLEAARRIGVAPETCVYVGDDARDIVAGRAAGMHTIAATYGYMGAEADVATWRADATIHSSHELLRMVKLA